MLRVVVALVAFTCIDETGMMKLYDEACCCTTGWCAPIEDRLVKEVPGGWRITITPGAHPRMLPGEYFVPDGAAKVSRDGRWHVCGWSNVQCFYKVGGAV